MPHGRPQGGISAEQRGSSGFLCVVVHGFDFDEGFGFVSHETSRAFVVLDLGDSIGALRVHLDLGNPLVGLALLVRESTAIAPLVMPYGFTLAAVIGVVCPASGSSEMPGDCKFFL